jgi:hypothetical protein
MEHLKEGVNRMRVLNQKQKKPQVKNHQNLMMISMTISKTLGCLMMIWEEDLMMMIFNHIQ